MHAKVFSNYLQVKKLYVINRSIKNNKKLINPNILYLQFMAICTLAVFGTMTPLAVVHLYVPA